MSKNFDVKLIYGLKKKIFILAMTAETKVDLKFLQIKAMDSL